VESAKCNQKCPFGNNACVEEHCSRCFPIFPTDWSRGICNQGAICGERCDSDSDCRRPSDSHCNFCRLKHCTVAQCTFAGLCQIDQDCVVGPDTEECRFCNQGNGMCVPLNNSCFQQKDFTFEQGCVGTPDWYFPVDCSEGCDIYRDRARCHKHENGALRFEMTPCPGCRCSGSNQDDCYYQVPRIATTGIMSGYQYCQGEFTWTVSGPYGSAVNTTATDVGLLFRLTDTWKGFVRDSLQLQVKSSGNKVDIELLVTGARGCRSTVSAVIENFDITGKHQYSLHWFAFEVEFLVDGAVLGNYRNQVCEIPQESLYVNFDLYNAKRLPYQTEAILHAFNYRYE